jgi:tRNA A-37 threonylcarbamoyl transferase component Bud32
MPEHARAKALAALAGYFETAAGMRAFGSFTGAYMKAAHLDLSFAAKLRRAIESARSRRFRSRTARCLINSSKFTVENSGRRRTYRRRDLQTGVLDEIAAGKNGNATVLSESQGARSKAVRVTLDGKEKAYFVKEFSKPTIAQSLRAIFIGPRARRAYKAGHGLTVRGLETPEVKACTEGGKHDLLITEFIEKGEPLDRLAHRLFVADRLSEEKGVLLRQREFIRALADEIRRMHDAGVYHPDLKAKNILVTEEGSTWRFLFVDLADVRFTPPSTRRIIKNLVQLNASIPYCIGDGLRARFFLRYLHGEKRGKRKAMLEEIVRGSNRRVERWRMQIEKAGKQKAQ